MNKAIYALAYTFLWTVAWLPLRVQFVFTDLAYVIVYHVVGYRKKIVRQNLERSFPEKGQAELRDIERRFYRHFCDSFVEWMYPLHRSAAQMETHYKVVNPEVLHRLYDQGMSVAGILGHYGNWEYLSLLPTQIKHKVWAIHKPLKNRHFNNLINKLRSKYGVHMMDTKESFRVLATEAGKGEVTLTYFLADQSPQRSKIKYRTVFLHQDTPIFLGAEQIAVKLNMAVVFFDIRKVARGKYELHFELLCDNPRALPTGAITELHVRALERAIRREPAYWLWSHRRWKHSLPVEDQAVIAASS
jgi:KDO2-lipid IV(A) lauroyltransferase